MHIMYNFLRYILYIVWSSLGFWRKKTIPHLCTLRILLSRSPPPTPSTNLFRMFLLPNSSPVLVFFRGWCAMRPPPPPAIGMQSGHRLRETFIVRRRRRRMFRRTAPTPPLRVGVLPRPVRQRRRVVRAPTRPGIERGRHLPPFRHLGDPSLRTGVRHDRTRHRGGVRRRQRREQPPRLGTVGRWDISVEFEGRRRRRWRHRGNDDDGDDDDDGERRRRRDNVGRRCARDRVVPLPPPTAVRGASNRQSPPRAGRADVVGRRRHGDPRCGG